jgi:lipopolysaccharide/colanic/teichoic acid biosynthesis glycosyltransferase
MPPDLLTSSPQTAAWKPLLAAALAAALAALSRLAAARLEAPGPGWLALLGLHAGLTLLLERALRPAPLSHPWRYRLAFLLSAAWFAAYGLAYPALAAVAALGAFLGGLLATGVNERLWEDNAPPSERIREEVRQRHVERAGAPPPTPRGKRLFDVALSLGGLLLSTPLWLSCAFLLWLEDPGPLLFVKNSVGKGGVNFRQLKFRTMVREAEHATGPVLAVEGDTRVLAIGRILRKSALDELPQLVNILRGEMSFVGPRPQRTVLVQGYLERLPAYAERHRTPPGLAGLAQVVGDYYLTPLQKLRFDRLYIRHASLGLDIKLILLAFLIAFWFRWQKSWNGRLPRRLVRWPGAGRSR